MARKTRKGYYVDGEFVPEGSDRDRRLQAEPDGFDTRSRSELKRDSAELQSLGEGLLGLRIEVFSQLPLPPELRDAIEEARGISARGGKRRQLQFIGKLMRQQEPGTIAAIRAALGNRAGS